MSVAIIGVNWFGRIRGSEFFHDKGFEIIGMIIISENFLVSMDLQVGFVKIN